jgi:mannose-6-phosphate isomerase
LAPVQEFELSVTTLGARKAGAAVAVPGEGPRIIIGTDGELELSVSDTSHADLFGPGEVTLRRGQAIFAAATERVLTARGFGQIVQCAVP